jgi:peroxiredoxin
MDFSLRGVDSFRIGTFSPSDQPRRNDFVVLSCYAYDFSPVCTEQVCELHNLDVFGMVDDATLWGLAPDGPYAHKEFIDEHDIEFPLLCDTAGRVAGAYVLYEGIRRLELPERRLATLAGVVGRDPQRLPEGLLLVRVVQRRRGVDRDQDPPPRPAEFAVEHLAGLARDGHVPAQQVFGGHLPDGDDERRVDLCDLAQEVRAAVPEFRGAGVAVVRRPTPHAVRDPDVRPRDADLPEGPVEDVAAPPDEGLALLVLAGAGRLADEQ